MTHPIVQLCLAGRISPTVALARLLLGGMAPDEIEPLLPPESDLSTLFATQRANLGVTAAMLRDGSVRHEPRLGEGGVAQIAAMFDQAVALSPGASVAAYSFGDDGLLAAATNEIVAWLLGTGFVDRSTDALDLGCGIGRVGAALAPHVRSVVGLDVSAGMIAEAVRRHAAVPNLRFAQTAGQPAVDLPDKSLDLVLAVDVMPYLVETGLAGAHVGDAARLLRPGGRLVMLNLSYRGDDEADAADAREWARSFGLSVAICGERPFTIWDGAAFVLRAPPP